MHQITEFSEDYPNINEMVTRIYWYALSKEEVEADPDSDPETASRFDYRFLDYFIDLKDGDTYSLTGRTLEQVKEVMEEENMKSWVEAGGVVLREISDECILDSVEQWLSHFSIYGLAIGAVLQSKWSEEDEEIEEEC